MAAVEEAMKRLLSHKGVVGGLVLDSCGIALRSTFDNDTTVACAALVSNLTVKVSCSPRRTQG